MQLELLPSLSRVPVVDVADGPPAGQLVEWIESGLHIHQGPARGEPFTLVRHFRRFVREAFKVRTTTAALSQARGGGKSTTIGAVCAAHIVGPLAQPHSEIVVAAPSMRQCQIIYRSTRALLGPWIDAEGPRVWAETNTHAIQRMRNRRTGIEFFAVPATNPDRLEGFQPVLVIVDEAAALNPNTSEQVRAILNTSAGKIEGFKMLAISTWPVDPTGWFTAWCEGGADYSQVHQADLQGDPFDPKQWKKANPSLRDRRFRVLLRETAAEAEKARLDPYEMAAFRAKRLNLGGHVTEVPTVLEAGEWEQAGGEAERVGEFVLGVDPGAATSMTGLCAYWPASGRIEVLGFFGSGSLSARERRAGLAGQQLYTVAHERGELHVVGTRVPNLAVVLEVARARWGIPAAVVTDAARRNELADALEASEGYNPNRSPLIDRRMNYAHGSEDLREFRTAVIEGLVVDPEPRSLLLAAALRSARVTNDSHGNSKLARKVEAGRRHGSHDDVLAAALLAVSLGRRHTRRHGTQPHRAPATATA